MCIPTFSEILSSEDLVPHRREWETVRLHGIFHTLLGYLLSVFLILSAAYFIGSLFLLSFYWLHAVPLFWISTNAVRIVGFVEVNPRYYQASSSLLTVQSYCVFLSTFALLFLSFLASLHFVLLLRVRCFPCVLKSYWQCFLREVCTPSGGMLSVCSCLGLCLWLRSFVLA